MERPNRAPVLPRIWQKKQHEIPINRLTADKKIRILIPDRFPTGNNPKLISSPSSHPPVSPSNSAVSCIYLYINKILICTPPHFSGEYKSAISYKPATYSSQQKRRRNGIPRKREQTQKERKKLLLLHLLILIPVLAGRVGDEAPDHQHNLTLGLNRLKMSKNLSQRPYYF